MANLSDLVAFALTVTTHYDETRVESGGCNLQVAGCRLQVAGCRLQVAGYKLQITGQM